MTNVLFFDDHSWENLLPLSFTRPVCEMRCGILTIKEKWQKAGEFSISWLSRDYLSQKFPPVIEADNYLINGALFPNRTLIEAILGLKHGEALTSAERILALRVPAKAVREFNPMEPAKYIPGEYSGPMRILDYPWQIFQWNGEEINSDFDLLTKDRVSFPISNSNHLIHPERIFVEEGFKAEYSSLNATNGPIYLGKSSEIMEGCLIRGPFALGEHAALKMGAKIYGPTTVVPHCKVGGEVNNSVIFGYSNKGHDGFLGNSVLGEWCNLGADTNNSNLKNNYAEVKLWNYPAEKFIPTGLQFCGLIMGDHSKCGINTMFNTGTVVGVGANIFGAGYPRNFVPCFSWGGAHGLSTFALPKVFEVAEEVMSRRNLQLTEADRKILSAIFQMTAKYRR